MGPGRLGGRHTKTTRKEGRHGVQVVALLHRRIEEFAARAAERLGIESRRCRVRCATSNVLLDVQLFDRSTRQTRLTWLAKCCWAKPGACSQRSIMRYGDQGAAQRLSGTLRIGICDSLAQPRIALLLARSRTRKSQDIASLSCRSRSSSKACTTTCSTSALRYRMESTTGWWPSRRSDPLSVIVPARHPLLAHVQVKLQDAFEFPLVLCRGCRFGLSQPNPGGAGWSSRNTGKPTTTSLGVMLTLVGAGWALVSRSVRRCRLAARTSQSGRWPARRRR